MKTVKKINMKKVITLGIFSFTLAQFSFAQPAGALKDAIRMTDNEQYEKASSVFKALAAKDGNADVYFYFGENYLATENIDSAKAQYKKGNDINPKNPLNTIGLGKAAWYDGKKQEAMDLFNKAFAAAAEKSNKVKDELKARMYLEAAEALIHGPSKDAATALNYIAKSLELNPNNPETYIAKADGLYEMDKLSVTEPLVELKKALELDKTSAKVQSRMAFMYYRAGQYERAVKVYTDAINLDKSFAPAYRGRADANYYFNKIEDALADFAKYLEMNKGNESATVRYAWFLFLAKKYDESLKLTNELLVKRPDETSLYRLRGYNQFELGNYTESEKSLIDFISKTKDEKILVGDYDYLARTYEKQNNDSLRILTLEKALVKDPKRLPVYFEIAKYYAEKKRDFVKATEWMTKKMAAGRPEINDYYYRGRWAFFAGQCQLTIDDYTEYVKVQKDYHVGYKILAQGHACVDSLNTTWAAKPHYETMLAKIKPEDKEKFKKDVEEAYFYFGSYYFQSAEKDMAKAKCYYETIKAMNTGTEISKRATAILESKEFKPITAATGCQ